MVILNLKFLPGTVLPVLCVFIYITVTNAGDWSYVGQTGPRYWHELFPEKCGGMKQSPININTEDTVEDPGLKPFALWYDPPKPGSKFYLFNNGHSVQVDTIGEFYVTNGGLNSVYSTAQFHFHWGHHHTHGSEHKIDGRPSPIELHVVNYNSDKYPSIVDALMEPQGLAVLGVMFEVSERDNPVLEPLIMAMERVKDPELKARVEIPAMPIRDLLPEDTSRYFRYNGSLTTPGCFESVVWTLFTERQMISHRQLMKFRHLLKPKHERKNRKHHKRSHRRMRRSERQKEAGAEEVLEEIGIKDNVKEEIHLMKELKNKANKEMNANHSDASNGQTEGQGNDMKPTIGETPDKFHLYDDDSPDLEKVKHKSHHHKHNGENNADANEWIQINWEEFGISPDNLVNNYRPVQPLNDRMVLRSFSLDSTRKKEVAYVLSEDNTATDGGENGASTLKQLSVFTLLINILLGIFIL